LSNSSMQFFKKSNVLNSAKTITGRTFKRSSESKQIMGDINTNLASLSKSRSSLFGEDSKKKK